MLTRPSMELSHNDNSSEIEAMSESSSVHDAENDGYHIFRKNSTEIEVFDKNVLIFPRKVLDRKSVV